MSAIPTAIDAIFDDSNVAKGASWRAGGGDVAVPCRVTLAQPDTEIDFGKSRALVATAVVDVRVREIAAPAKDDEVDILDDAGSVLETLKILADPKRDDDREVWSCEAVEV